MTNPLGRSRIIRKLVSLIDRSSAGHRILPACPRCGGRKTAAVNTLPNVPVWHCFKCGGSGYWSRERWEPVDG
jgi:hypothetical protein